MIRPVLSSVEDHLGLQKNDVQQCSTLYSDCKPVDGFWPVHDVLIVIQFEKSF